ncbi:MAG TPA: HAD-IB family phosphatase [Armatimonadota bacterium]|jgi:2,3-diketo-5-methylthio-1-phosphopentane phosphatase
MCLSEKLTLGPGDLVLSDYDGTISLLDNGIEMITRLGNPAAWDLEERWRRGEISSMECMRGQWELIVLPQEQLLTELDSLPLDESFPEFVALCRERQADLAVVSDGLDLYVERGLRRLGLHPCWGTAPLSRAGDCVPFFANHGEWTEHGVEVSFPLTERRCEACGDCKTARLFSLLPGHRRVIYLGDGHSDKCVARYADVLFARDHLAEYCTDKGLPFLPFASFREVIEALS